MKKPSKPYTKTYSYHEQSFDSTSNLQGRDSLVVSKFAPRSNNQNNIEDKNKTIISSNTFGAPSFGFQTGVSSFGLDVLPKATDKEEKTKNQDNKSKSIIESSSTNDYRSARLSHRNEYREEEDYRLSSLSHGFELSNGKEYRPLKTDFKIQSLLEQKVQEKDDYRLSSLSHGFEFSDGKECRPLEKDTQIKTISTKDTIKHLSISYFAEKVF